jgi:hypothetical protein
MMLPGAKFHDPGKSGQKSYQAWLVEYLGSRLSSMLQAKIVSKQIQSSFLPAE